MCSKTGDLAEGVDARVGAARAVQNEAFLGDAAQNVYDFTLDGRFVRLDLPAVEVGAVVGKIKTQAHAVLTNAFPAVNDVDINLVWTPRWDPRIMASEEAKAELGIW